MKKTFLAISALAAMLFAGCTSSDELTTLESIKTADNTPTPVQFGTYMGKTRAGVTGNITTDGTGSTQSLQDGKSGTSTKGFGVFAYNTGAGTWSSIGASTKPNFMWNQQVYYDSGWKYEPIKYWPNGKDTKNGGTGDPSNTASEGSVQNLSFFAYAPYVNPANTGIFASAETSGITALTANNISGAPIVTYAFASNDWSVANNVDLLWGTNGKKGTGYHETDNDDNAATSQDYNTDLTKQIVSSSGTNETVDFLFKHALAKIGGKNGLKVVADIDGNSESPTTTGFGTLDNTTLITVKSIQIGNVENAVVTNGTFNLATGSWTASNNPSIAERAITADVAQSALSTTIKEPETLSATTAPAWNSTNTRWETNTGAGGGAASGTAFGGVPTSTPADVYESATDAFYLIPSSTADQQLKVSITYVVRTYDTNLAVPTDELSPCSKVEQTITNTVTLAHEFLASNKYFTLVLHLGLTSVKFSATVSAWDTTGSVTKEVWLPSNVVVTP